MGFLSPEAVLKDIPLRADSVVADFGAGSGGYTFAAAHRVGEEGAVYAIDIQKDLVARLAREAQERGLSHVYARVGDLETREGSGLPSGSVDLVILSNVLFQAENPKAMLEEAWRVLAPDGAVLVVDWSDSFGGLGPPPERVVLPQQVREWLVGIGFVVEREWVPAEHHWALYARKPRTVRVPSSGAPVVE